MFMDRQPKAPLTTEFQLTTQNEFDTTGLCFSCISPYQINQIHKHLIKKGKYKSM